MLQRTGGNHSTHGIGPVLDTLTSPAIGLPQNSRPPPGEAHYIAGRPPGRLRSRARIARGGRLTMADTFEAALVATERGVDAALKTVAAASRELRKARLGAKNGQVRELRKALSAAEAAAAALAGETRAARTGLDLDEQEP